MALGWVGTRTVASESENTQEAIQCGLYWDSSRRMALRDFPWNFAQRRAWLASVDVPSGYEREYRYAYKLPEDCLKALEVKEGGERKVRFVVAADRMLLTDAQDALLCYTADVEQVDDFDDMFAQAMSRKLAAMIVVPLLKNNAQKVQELEQLYRAAIPLAMEADAGEGQEAEKPDSWLESRGGY